MESEKVKEIKKSLQRKINRAKKVGDALINCVSIEALKMYLTLINELESENERWQGVFDIANEREYRKKFNDEWRKEHQKELDKQGNGHIAGFPDFDLVYKLYFEKKDRIAELEKENKNKTDTIVDLLKKQEFYEKEKLTKFAERLIEKAKKGNYIDKRSHANLTDFIIDIDETLKEFVDD